VRVGLISTHRMSHGTAFLAVAGGGRRVKRNPDGGCAGKVVKRRAWWQTGLGPGAVLGTALGLGLGAVLGTALGLGMGSAIERLGPVGCTHCCACTSGLSTWWSTTALERDLVLRRVSRLDAFSGYPCRT
jgi:hypothetical protein